MEATLNEVEGKIRDVELEINGLRKDKPQFWREDLSALRKEEEQLWEEKLQLREENLFLLRNQ